jgi:hypothetical protein
MTPSPEDQAIRAALSRRTRAVVAKVVRGLAAADLGVAALADDDHGELAAKRGVPVARVYRARHGAWRRLGASRELRALWEEATS